MKKRVIGVLILALIVAATIYGLRRYKESELENVAGDIKIYGTVDIRTADLAFIEQERISEVLAEEGERVEKGQALARLNTDRLKASISEMRARIGAQEELVKRLKAGNRPQEIEQARAEVEAAKVRVDNTEQILARLNQTVDIGATSKQDLDDTRAQLMVERAQHKVRVKALNLVLEGPRREDIAAAEKNLEAMQANMSLLSIRLADMTLFAPTGGTIRNRILEPGEMAGPTRPVFSMALDDPKWVRAYIPEPLLGRIKLGMQASILSDSFLGQPLEGWVGFISPVAEFTPRTVQTEDLRTKLVYETRVFVTDREDRLRLGMPVTVIIDDKTAASAPPPQDSSPEDIPGKGASLLK